MPVLSDNPTPITTTSTPVLQDWGFNPSTIVIDHYLGEALPAPVTVATIFKDVAGTPAVAYLGDLKYRTYVNTNPSAPVCVVMSSPDGLFSGSLIYNDYVNGIQGDMLYTFQNLNLLTPGTYTFAAIHQIRGLNASGIYSTVSQQSYFIKIRVFPATAPTFSPSTIIYNWVIGSTAPLSSSTLQISGTNWLVKAPAGFAFNNPPGTTVVQPTSWGGAELSGTGTVSFIMTMFPGAVPDVIDQNPIYFTLEINGGVLQIPIQVNFLQDNGLFLGQSQLEFTSYIGISNAIPQYVHIYYPGNYDFVVPPWLTVLPHPGAYNNNYGFWPLAADSMEPGVYEFDVLVTNESGTEVLGTIHVVYNVVGAILSPYPAYGHAYTLDRDFIEFVSQYDNTYFELQLNVRAYDFYSAAYKDYSYPFKIALFNRRQLFNIGQVVHRLMANFTDYLQDGSVPYLPAEVSLAVREKSTVDAEFLNEYQVNNIRFIAGLRPELKAGCGILDINPGASRVTARSFYYLNYVTKNFAQVNIFKNGELINPYSVTEGIHEIKLDFQNLGAAQGDVFEFRLITTEGNLSKFFKVIPDSFESNYIIWENEYKLKSALECTGDYKINSELENRSQSLYLQLVDVLTKLESTKVSKLTINTGWLLKSDKASIESLVRAKRAALVVGDRVINLVPVTKSINNVDNKEALVSYDLEFEINRKFNEEIYSF